MAGRCDFNIDCKTCNQAVSYQYSVVRFKLIQGLTDAEIKEHILSEEDKPLDETVRAIEAKESGKVARKAIGVSTSPAKVNFVGDGSTNNAVTAAEDRVTVQTEPVGRKNARHLERSA